MKTVQRKSISVISTYIFGRKRLRYNCNVIGSNQCLNIVPYILNMAETISFSSLLLNKICEMRFVKGNVIKYTCIFTSRPTKEWFLCIGI